MDHLPLFLGARKVKSGLATVSHEVESEVSQSCFHPRLGRNCTHVPEEPARLLAGGLSSFPRGLSAVRLECPHSMAGKSKPRDPSGSRRLFMTQHQTSYTFTSAILRGSQGPVRIQCGERPAKGPILEAGYLPPTYKDS